MSGYARSIELDGKANEFNGSADLEASPRGQLLFTTTVVNDPAVASVTLTLEPDRAREIAGALLFAADFADHRREQEERRG